MRVVGFEGTRSVFQAIHDHMLEHEEDDDNLPEVKEYVIEDRSTDLKGLRLLLSNGAFSSEFTIIENDRSYSILEWIDENINQSTIIHDFLRSRYFSVRRIEGTEVVPALTDNQLLFYLRHMLYNVQEYGYLIQQSRDYYHGEDDDRIFSHYQLMITDLMEINTRAYLDIQFNRPHIIEEIESSPDHILKKFDY